MYLDNICTLVFIVSLPYFRWRKQIAREARSILFFLHNNVMHKTLFMVAYVCSIPLTSNPQKSSKSIWLSLLSHHNANHWIYCSCVGYKNVHRNNKNYSVNKTKAVCFSIIFFRIKYKTIATPVFMSELCISNLRL